MQTDVFAGKLQHEEKRTRKVKYEGMQAMGMNYERGYRTNCFSNSVMDFSILE